MSQVVEQNEKQVAKSLGSPFEKAMQWVKKEKSFLFVIITILLVRGSLINWYKVPSESMVPTLLVGDYIVVNRLAYSVNFPFSQTALFHLNEPSRGETIVFDYPPEPSTLYVKRIVGIPGDKILITGGKLFINNKESCIPKCDLLTVGEFELTVPQDQFFVMGDNRGNSADSRVWGYVPRQNIRGRAGWIALNLNWENYLPKFNFSRSSKLEVIAPEASR